MRKEKSIKINYGQAIFLVLVILASVISIGLVFGLINIQRLHSIKKAEESVKALYASESGIECDLYKEIVDHSVDCDSSQHMTNRTSYELEVSTEGTTTIIRSVGKSSNVYRALEVRY